MSEFWAPEPPGLIVGWRIRRARRNRRSRLVITALVWLTVFGCGFVIGTIAAVLATLPRCLP